MEREIMIQNQNDLKDRIYEIRGNHVMLDCDLAEIYGYSTKALNQQVKNNIEKFDDDFFFKLTKNEYDLILRSKFLTLEQGKYSKYLPYAFTEQGIYMLMTVLKGDLAIRQSKMLVRLFKEMKDYIVENQFVLKKRDVLRLSLQTEGNSQNINELRKELAKLDDKVENVVNYLGDMVRKSELSPILLNLGKSEIPTSLLILNGQLVESDLAYQNIYTLAQSSIFIVDNYISLKTLILFKNAKQDISVTIFSDNIGNGLHKAEYEDFCKEYAGLKINIKESGKIFHDRYIVLDYDTENEKIYHCGGSSKDGGRKITTITLLEDTSLYKELFAKLMKNKALLLK